MEMVLLMPFLYFPEDKTLYIPAVASLLVCMLVSYLVFLWIKKISRKQEAAAREFEQRILSEREVK